MPIMRQIQPGQTHGLARKLHGFGGAPHWTEEPDVHAIARTVSCVLADGPPESYSVRYLGPSGDFTKAYAVQRRDASSAKAAPEYVVRVMRPVDPGYKTLSEAATLEFVRTRTSLPVPAVVAFDAGRDNDVVFEWLLEQRMPGTPLAEAWDSMSWAAKRAVVTQMARYAAELFRHQFPRLGALYLDDAPQMARRRSRGDLTRQTAPDAPFHRVGGGYHVGRLVSMAHSCSERSGQDMPRGPFASGHAWFAARLALVQNDNARIMATSAAGDDDERAYAPSAVNLSAHLRQMLDQVLLPQAPVEEIWSLPPFAAEARGRRELFTLVHHDLARHNILVDAESGCVTGVLGWEFASTLPLWRACQPPAFLGGDERTLELDGDRYDEDEGSSSMYPGDKDGLECAMLRRIFYDEVAALRPMWEMIRQMSRQQQEFDDQVSECGVLSSRFSAERKVCPTHLGR